MKIKGFDGSLFEKRVFSIEIGEQRVDFLLTSLPLDFYERLEKEIPTPVAPVAGVIRDHRNKLIRDETGRPVVKRDEEDPTYKEAMRVTQRCQSVAMVLEGLRGDENIEFETSRETWSNPKDFYQEIWKEMQKVISMKIFLQLMDEIGKMTAVSDEQIEEAKQAFL